MKTFHRKILIAKMFADYVGILFVFALAYIIRVDFLLVGEFPYVFSTDFPFEKYMLVAMYTAPVWILMMYYMRGYNKALQVRSWHHVRRVSAVCMFGIAFYLVTFFFQGKQFFSRLIILYVAVFSCVCIYGSHLFFDWLARKFYSRGVGTISTLIIGTTREAERLIEKLSSEKSIHKPVAILDGYGTKRKDICGVPVLGKLNKLEDTVKEYAISQIIQTDNLEQTVNIVNFAAQNGLKYAMLPTLLGIYDKESRVEEVEGVAVVRVR